ncbi:metalloregulator ArsR/SmtB family transcription factor [Microlunatus panaciterrae]|uniref:DNA-binding transcriptional ArsR family regulator n=1 Tax=Microlunatus panaciterrae TaxID=400768 RepID=A0ABS2RG78_9ACTN|nr:DNA-binding transcriptional ArsR family regulator [Microlunatus panaciterrae]
MSVDVFAVVAEPRRRDILDQLRAGPASVSELVQRLNLPQPTVSKHLRVLRQHGFVSSRAEAQRRIYSLNQGPLLELADWVLPYQRLWSTSFDALTTRLDTPNLDEESRDER